MKEKELDQTKELSIDEMFVMALEEEAAKLEITVDYYIWEFL